MAAIGIERLVYSVEDRAASVRYFEAFGPVLERREDDAALFRLPEGSSVHDFDALDDNWIPRIDEVKFSFSTWLSVLPPFMMAEPGWDWRFHPDYLPGAKRGSTTPMEKPFPEEVI